MSGTRPPRRRAAVLAVLCLTVAAAAFSTLYIGQGYWLDDSFISFRYARNMIEGHGLVYNVGDPVEGYTNFLWTLVAALGLLLGIEPIHFTQAVSVLAQAATLWALYEIGRAGGQRGWRPVFAPLFLASSVAFLAYPMTGMETSFFTMLLTVSFLLLAHRKHETRGGGIAVGLVLFALGTTRFDGFGPVLLLLSYPLLFDRSRSLGGRLKALAWPVGVLVVAFTAYNAWRLAFYPTPLPNTFYAKTSFSLDRLDVGLGYLTNFALGQGVLVIVLGVLPFALYRASPIARFAAWVVFGQACYVALVGGDWMPHHRFLLPVMPLLFALMQEGWFLAAAPMAERTSSPRVAAGSMLAVVLVFNLAPLLRGLEFDELSGPHFDQHTARRIGRYLEENLPADQVIAIEWGGIVPYYTHHRTLDTYGLTDRAIVLADFPKTVWGRRIKPNYLAQRSPDLIVPNAHVLATEEAAYRSVRPGGPNHYSYYGSMAGTELPYAWKVFRLAEDAWWPGLVRRGPDSIDSEGTGRSDH